MESSCWVHQSKSDHGDLDHRQQCGTGMGLVPSGQTSASGYTSGPFALFNGTDYQTKEPGGAIDILLRLETAVRDGNIPEIGRLQGLLDNTMAETTRTRGKVGVWSQNIESFKAASEDQSPRLRPSCPARSMPTCHRSSQN